MNVPTFINILERMTLAGGGATSEDSACDSFHPFPHPFTSQLSNSSSEDMEPSLSPFILVDLGVSFGQIKQVCSQQPLKKCLLIRACPFV